MPATPPSPTPRRASARLIGAGGLIVLVAVVIVVVALSSGGGTGTTLTTATLPPVHPGRAGPESMFTPASELATDPAGTLDRLAALGVDRIHVYMHWADIAPDPTSPHEPSFNAADPAAYPAANWAIYDTIVRDVYAHGMGIDLALVPPPPAWAAGKGAPDPSTQPYWRPSAAEYGQFVRAVATRYSGHYVPPGASHPLPRVSFWSIWNEPNVGAPQLAPQAIPHTHIEVSGRLYRGLVDAAWSALQATGHGHDTILIGEIAPAGATFGDAPGLFAAMAPLRFLRALYCVDASYRPLRGAAAKERGCPTTAAGSAGFAAAHPGLFHATGFADHPYPQGLPPDSATPDEPDYAELADMPQLERALDTLQRVYGSHTRFPIWSTEYGYQTTPPDTEIGTVNPTLAADYLNWSEYITWLNPRLRSYDQYLLIDDAGGVFATGLENANGTPKPGYFAYRMPIFLPATKTKAGHPLEVWGCVRPAPRARLATHRQQHVQIQFRRAGSAVFTTVRTLPLTDRHGYLDVLQTFPGSGTVRLAWSYPKGPEIFSRAVAVTVG